MNLRNALRVTVLMLACHVGRMNGDTNNVLSLTGENDSFLLVPSLSAQQNNSAITVEAWVWSAGDVRNPDAAVINVGDGINATSDRAYDVRFSPSGSLAVEVFFSDGSWTFLTTTSPTNVWTHVAFTFDSSPGLLGLYTNGVLAASTNSIGATPLQGKLIRQSEQPLIIGGILEVSATRFHGAVDEIRVWNKARRQEEIAYNRWCPLSGSEPHLIAYFNFDTGAATDLTSHGNDGTLQDDATIKSATGSDVVHSGCITCRLTGATLTPDQLIRLSIAATAGKPIRVDASTNLTQWTPLATLPNAQGTAQFIDPDTKTYPKRFYRAVVP